MTTSGAKEVILLDSDLKIHDMVKGVLACENIKVTSYFSAAECLRKFSSSYTREKILITDYNFHDTSADLFKKKISSDCENIRIFSIDEVKTVGGVIDVLKSPSFSKDVLINPDVFSSNGIIGQSPVFLEAVKLARKIAGSSTNIFISGESGTGKEVFAKFIHSQSANKQGPFVPINCSSIPENLLETELFGHAKGAFTGAHDKKIGLFEEAQGGTLFLDEIGDLSLALQAKLLRVLQERKIKRVGENQFRDIDCRIISATHKDLAVEVYEKRFREDLFFRLNVIPILIPALRNRQEDIGLLSNIFLRKFSLLNNLEIKSFSKEAEKYLSINPWRGNVRELENLIERAVVMSSGPVILVENFMPLSMRLNDADVSFEAISNFSSSPKFIIKYDEKLPTLETVIDSYIDYAIKINNGAKDKTAKEIGVDRKTIYKRLKRERN